jgi:hypothetical protein
MIVHDWHADESPEEVDYYDYDIGLPPGCVETHAGAPSPQPTSQWHGLLWQGPPCQMVCLLCLVHE